MKIETYVNFKLRSGEKMLAGIYDDSKKPFPDEIYEEIERNRNTADRRRWTLRVLDENESAASSASSIDDADPENMTTQDDGTNVINTSSSSKRRRRSRKK